MTFEMQQVPCLSETFNASHQSDSAVHSSDSRRDVELAWAAGILDGEGCIHIARQRYRGARSDTFRLCVHVTQNHVGVLEHFREAVAVDASIYPTKRAKNHRRQCYSLNFSGHKAVAVLSLLLAFLKRKRPEAEAALEFWVNSRSGLRSGDGRVDPTVMAVREHYFDLLKQLK